MRAPTRGARYTRAEVVDRLASLATAIHHGGHHVEGTTVDRLQDEQMRFEELLDLMDRGATCANCTRPVHGLGAAYCSLECALEATEDGA